VTAVFIDNGLGMAKAGFAGDDAPRSIFHTGRPKMPFIMVSLDQTEVYVGAEADFKKGVLKMKTQLIQDLFLIEMIWKRYGIIHSTMNLEYLLRNIQLF
jgi:actin-related protein